MSGPRVLAVYTTVNGVTYPPGPVPDEVAEQITVESVWESEPDGSAPAKKTPAKRASSKTEK